MTKECPSEECQNGNEEERFGQDERDGQDWGRDAAGLVLIWELARGK
jgi:hypothetical protein